MSGAPADAACPGDPPPHLRVAPFLREFTTARAIGCAFETGVIDAIGEGSKTPSALAAALGLDPRTLPVLLRLLSAANVTVSDGGGSVPGALALSPAFREALRFRELMLATIEFARIVTPDLTERFELLLREPEAFMAGSALFGLFDYARAFGDDPADLEATRRWMRFTTELTRHEAPALLGLGVGEGRERLLDIGGNSGEFARQACERHGGLRATVVDLPGVCAIGRDWVSTSRAADRIAFLARDALTGPLPRADWVNFKSMLHDWPDPAAETLLARARASLSPGGQLVIFERSADVPDDALTSYAFTPMLPFLHGFRSAGWYAQRLIGLGLRDVEVRSLRLDADFLMVRARA